MNESTKDGKKRTNRLSKTKLVEFAFLDDPIAWAHPKGLDQACPRR